MLQTLPKPKGAQLAQKDATFMTVVDRYQDVQSLQEISSTCIDLQRALGYGSAGDLADNSCSS